MTDFEVIVVDDGSTDPANYRCIEKMVRKDERLKIIKNSHQGLALTRKEGFLQSRGDYIFFMDCDDYLPNDALKTLYMKAVDSAADVTIGKYDRVADSFGLIPIKASAPKYENVERLIPKEDILRVCYGPLIKSVEDPVTMVVWGRLFKSSCIHQAVKKKENTLFFVCNRMEDYYFNLVLMPFIDSLYLTNDIVYHYRYGGKSNTTIDHTGDTGGFFNYRFDQFEEWNFQEGHPRTFAAFAANLFWDLRNLIPTGIYSQDKTRAFLKDQITSNKIVNWARNNMEQIESLPYHYKMIASESPDEIYKWYYDALHTNAFNRHYILKKCAIASAKVLDFVYGLLH
jgi:glycosyltransferase involved in cell wall biosynthesis